MRTESLKFPVAMTVAYCDTDDNGIVEHGGFTGMRRDDVAPTAHGGFTG